MIIEILMNDVYMLRTINYLVSFRTCVHCGREYEDVFNRRICSSKCSIEISS